VGSPLILIVDDEPSVRDLIADALNLAGYKSVRASHGLEALTKLRENQIDLIILDINMPSMDGYEVLQRMHEQGSRTPVIVLTARLDREDTKRAFELGADDFVRKPFGIEELTLRVNAILKRSGSQFQDESVISAGTIVINLDQHHVTVDEVPVDLSPTEFRLLQAFLQNPGRVLSKNFLLTEVWGIDNYADPNAVETYVSYLRKKLGSSLPLRTVRGVGYQLTKEVGR
jgi:two-component system OmpR family response regulator